MHGLRKSFPFLRFQSSSGSWRGSKNCAAKINEARGLRQKATEETEPLVLRRSFRLFETLRAERKPLGAIAQKRTGIAYKSDDFDDAVGVPVVRLKEIETKKPTVFLKNPKDYPNVWLDPGDIILAKTSFSTGAMCQWPGPSAVLNQNAIMLRANAGIDQRYLFLWLEQQVDRYLHDHLADPDFYPYIREADLVRWLVPAPNLAGQLQIVSELDALQARVDALKRLQTEAAAELNALLTFCPR